MNACLSAPLCRHLKRWPHGSCARPWLFVALMAALVVFCPPSLAQTYEFKQGYIFHQPFVKRIPLSEAIAITQQQQVFDDLMQFDWLEKKEVIHDPNVKRKGSRLIVSFGAGKQLSLKNFSTRKGDGEAQLFKYLTTLADHHLIGVQFGHDQPHFLLVPVSGSPVYFVDTN